MGLTVLDAGVLIAVLDSGDVHHKAALRAVRAAREAGETLVLPASAYAEMLVSPFRRGPEAVALANALVDELPARIEPATREIATRAASLRAAHGRGLRLPDALVIATAMAVGAARVITTDARGPEMGIDVTVVAGA